MSTPKRFTDAIHIGTGEFSFAAGATTRAGSRPPVGFRDIGNVEVYQLQVTNDTVEREGSYRGKKSVDASFSIKQQLQYMFRCDELTKDNLLMVMMGEDLSDNARSALIETKADAMDFSTTHSESRYWYDLLVSGEQQTHLSSVLVFGGAPVSAVTAATGGTFTAAGHGLSDGDRVMLVTLTTTTGPTTLTPYYVVGADTDTFQLSATKDGSAVTLTGDGTATYLAALTEDTDFEVDTEVGRVRFLTDQSAAAYVFLTGDAIAAGDDAYMKSIKPLEQASVEGYGRFLSFHAKTEALTWDHRDFSCSITPANFGEQDGKKPSTFDFMVKITSDRGRMFAAQRTIND